jgi:hypothetical protein
MTDQDGSTTVAGVVHASGAGGARTGGQADWTLQFSLQPWRRADGPLQETQLNVHRRVTEGELDEWMDRVEAYEALRLRVRFEETGARAELIEILGPADADEELTRRSIELQQPTTIEDEVFGTLVLDRRVDWYETRATWGTTKVQLYVSPDEQGGLQSSLRTAKALWSDQAAWDRRVRDYAVQELLRLKNESWLEEGEAHVSPEQFRSRMTLESLTVYPDGEFEFMHDDGELFWGHAIQVCGDLVDGPNDADIPG